MSYVCIGVPYWIGERQAVSAVDAIRDSGIVAELGAAWVEIQPDFAADPDPVVAVNRALAAAIRAHAEHTPLIFSADCVSGLGAMKGLETLNPAVLWYDAHGDFNTPATTPSGFLGGMPLAALVGRGNEALVQGIGLTPVAETDVILTDARDLDPGEKELLASSRVTHLPQVEALLTMPLPDKPLYIHFDTDVVNTDDMPAMSYSATGGPSLATTLATLERVKREAQVAGVLFSLWKHTLDGAKLSLANTLQIVRCLTAG